MGGGRGNAVAQAGSGILKEVMHKLRRPMGFTGSSGINSCTLPECVSNGTRWQSFDSIPDNQRLYIPGRSEY
jgi:hypothetical protein